MQFLVFFFIQLNKVSVYLYKIKIKVFQTVVKTQMSFGGLKIICDFVKTFLWNAK